MPAIEGSERDSTQDWIVPRGSVPLVGELEARIDEALVIARASEEGVREVGEMALDAAKQARRAAEAAEKSAAAAVAAKETVGMVDGSRPAGPVSDQGLSLAGESSRPSPPAGGGEAQDEVVPAPGEKLPARPRFETRFRSFTERADRVAARLQALGAHPSHSAGPSVGVGRRRGDY